MVGSAEACMVGSAAEVVAEIELQNKDTVIHHSFTYLDTFLLTMTYAML